MKRTKQQQQQQKEEGELIKEKIVTPDSDESDK